LLVFRRIPDHIEAIIGTDLGGGASGRVRGGRCLGWRRCCVSVRREWGELDREGAPLEVVVLEEAKPLELGEDLNATPRSHAQHGPCEEGSVGSLGAGFTPMTVDGRCAQKG